MNLFLLYSILFISIYYYYSNNNGSSSINNNDNGSSTIEQFGIGGAFKKLGKDIEKQGSKAGSGIADVGEKAGSGIADVAEEGVEGAKDVAEKGVKGAKDIADKAGDALDPMKQIWKQIKEFFEKFGIYAILIICCPCITFFVICILLLFISGIMLLITGKGLSIFSRKK